MLRQFEQALVTKYALSLHGKDHLESSYDGLEPKMVPVEEGSGVDIYM